MRIDYKLVDLKGEKYTDQIESFLELTENHLHWKAIYYADVLNIQEDDQSGWKNVMKSYDTWVKRDYVIGVGKSYMFDMKIWQIFIDASGLGGTIEMYFKRESEATEFAGKILNWMLNK